MASFDKLIGRVDALRSICGDNLNNPEIHEISVDKPTPPLNELYFRKVVAWGYVLFHETGPFIRFSGKLLRARPPAYEKFRRTKEIVQCARTVHTHNLHAEKKSDSRIIRKYEIWLFENGGESLNWELCSQALIKEVDEVLLEIQQEWARRCTDDYDRQELWRDYEMEKRTYWEGHEFDPYIARAAEDAKLDGFDSTAFRKDGNRIERWRKLASFFDSRGAAEDAIDRAIRSEILSVFGRGH